MEFIYSFEEIQKRYGERGITRLDTKQHWLEDADRVGKAEVLDDTQMTLFTANGLLNTKRQKSNMKYSICRVYIEWYLTQVGKWSHKYKDCWITRISELNKRRAPGNTCMSSLYAIYSGRELMNNSKGCGGVMRITPIPLYVAVQDRMSVEEADHLAGETAEITYQHPWNSSLQHLCFISFIGLPLLLSQHKIA